MAREEWETNSLLHHIGSNLQKVATVCQRRVPLRYVAKGHCGHYQPCQYTLELRQTSSTCDPDRPAT